MKIADVGNPAVHYASTERWWKKSRGKFFRGLHKRMQESEGALSLCGRLGLGRFRAMVDLTQAGGFAFQRA
jgi:hypothetical protein